MSEEDGRCTHCARYAVVTAEGKPLCMEHYNDLLKTKPWLRSWQDEMVDDLIDQHPEWKRQPDETKSEYNRRMFDLTRPLWKGVIKRLP